jgi:hypothetical protein
MNELSNRVFYLYGFARPESVPGPMAARSSASPCPPTSPGETARLDGNGIAEEHPPFVWRHGQAAAILSLVPREEFCGPKAESNLQDLAWVAPRACRHELVLEQAMQWSPVLPVRFGALFSSLEALGQFMERHRAPITQFLERVADQQEWAVKGLLDRPRAEAELCRQKLAHEGAAPASSPGLAYLQEQQLRLWVRQELDQRLVSACHALEEELTPLASEMCARQVLSPQLTGTDQEVITNWAFLVPQRAVAEFQGRFERVNASQALPGLAFGLSGPWPPYSFCPALDAESA